MMPVMGAEFIRRFLLHVLPPGFTKIRHYGLLGNNRRRQRLPPARAALQASPLRFAPNPPNEPSLSTLPPLSCPHCQGTQLHCIGRVEPSGTVRLFARATGWL